MSSLNTISVHNSKALLKSVKTIILHFSQEFKIWVHSYLLSVCHYHIWGIFQCSTLIFTLNPNYNADNLTSCKTVTRLNSRPHVTVICQLLELWKTGFCLIRSHLQFPCFHVYIRQKMAPNIINIFQHVYLYEIYLLGLE